MDKTGLCHPTRPPRPLSPAGPRPLWEVPAPPAASTCWGLPEGLVWFGRGPTCQPEPGPRAVLESRATVGGGPGAASPSPSSSSSCLGPPHPHGFTSSCHVATRVPCWVAEVGGPVLRPCPPVSPAPPQARTYQLSQDAESPRWGVGCRALAQGADGPPSPPLSRRTTGRSQRIPGP